MWIGLCALIVAGLVYGGQQRRKGYLCACDQLGFRLRKDPAALEVVKSTRREVEAERWWW